MTCSLVSTTTSGSQSFYLCNSDPNLPQIYQHMDSRGVTYWAVPDGVTYTIQPYSNLDISFTCTQPQCYMTQDSCIVLFNAFATTLDLNFRLNYLINGTLWGGVTLCCGFPQAGGWQAVDLAQPEGQTPYHDVGLNTFTIQNTSSTTVTIANFQIVRTYALCGLNCDSKWDQENAQWISSSCDGSYRCLGTYACKPESDQNPNQNFVTPVDYPCNLEQCGGRSYCYWHDPDSYNQIIPAGGCFQWNFDWGPSSQYNYAGKEVCLFNFNNVSIAPNIQNPPAWIELQLIVNGSYVTSYYISGTVYQSGFSPSFNLVNCSAYKDNDYNEVVLKNNSSYPVIMLDPGIDVYRWFKTDSCCESITVNQSPGGQISPGTVNLMYGASPIFTVTADDGYQIADVIIDQGTGNEQHMGGQNNPYSYQFNNIISNHTITATFSAPLPVLNISAIDYYGGNPMYPNVWVDGNSFGYAPRSIPVTPGPHTVTLDSTTYDRWWGENASFVIMRDSNNNYYDNPATIQVTSTMDIIALYSP